MKGLMIAVMMAAVCCASTSMAEPRERLGYGVLFTNDEFGDGKDRWRTGSFSSSRVWGRGWNGRKPNRLGDLIELRLGAQIISPESLRRPAPNDRTYVGAISAGLHTHATINDFDVALGADLTFTGPSTKLDDFQEAVHDILGGPSPSAQVRNSQIQDGLHPTAVLEIGRSIEVSGSARIRPFVELRAGVETLARTGFDLSFGPFGKGELLVRDPVSGHRYQAIRNDSVGPSFVLGADIAHVENSIFLPSFGNAPLKETRGRARAGVHWQGPGGGVFFYGLTWLSEEFQGQRESQFLGSVQFRIAF
ncbi:MAG: lipid A-modifier LpxR family protein [Paracoccaceae bacterium]